MQYNPIYNCDIPKDLSRIPLNMRVRIQRAIEVRLLVDPLGFGLPLRKSLRGYRKLRVGDYRIIYSITGNNVEILKIGHRKDAYLKVLERLSLD